MRGAALLDKASVRRKAISARGLLPLQERRQKSAAICMSLLSLPEVSRARIVAAYIQFGDEVDTRGLIATLWSSGKTVCVPAVKKGVMGFVVYSEGSALARTGLGFMEPKDGTTVDFRDIGVFIVPGAAFGREGGRLGLGKGLYDRFFGNNNPRGPKVGTCFSCQLFDSVPCEAHDVRMDIIITEKGAIRL